MELRRLENPGHRIRWELQAGDSRSHATNGRGAIWLLPTHMTIHQASGPFPQKASNTLWGMPWRGALIDPTTEFSMLISQEFQFLHKCFFSPAKKGTLEDIDMEKRRWISLIYGLNKCYDAARSFRDVEQSQHLDHPAFPCYETANVIAVTTYNDC